MAFIHPLVFHLYKASTDLIKEPSNANILSVGKVKSKLATAITTKNLFIPTRLIDPLGDIIDVCEEIVSDQESREEKIKLLREMMRGYLVLSRIEVGMDPLSESLGKDILKRII